MFVNMFKHHTLFFSNLQTTKMFFFFKFKTRPDPKLHPKNPGPYEQLMNKIISYIFVFSFLHVVM